MKHNLTLHDCLSLLPVRQLRALAASNSIVLGSAYQRQEWIETLGRHLSSTAHLQRIITSLSHAEKNALDMVAASGGVVAYHVFRTQFGEIRPWQPWRKQGEIIKPWTAPASPAEMLFYKGLIFLNPWQPGPGEIQQVVLPVEVVTYLSAQKELAQKQHAFHILKRPGNPPDILWHLTLFLAAAEEKEVRLLHGNWLPPEMLRRIAYRTGVDKDRGFEMRRSERYLPYLAFIHWLAQSAQLVDHNDVLQLSPRGWQWLAQDAPTQWQWVWKSWLTGQNEAAQRVGFGWGSITSEARAWMMRVLCQWLDEGQIRTLTDTVSWLKLQDDRERFLQPWGVEKDITHLLLTGPLWWLQLVELLEDSAGEMLIRMSHLGKWLACGKERLPEFPDRQRAYADPKDNTVIHVPVYVFPDRLVRASRYVQWRKSPHPSYEFHLQLTEEHIATAIARGESLRQIESAIEGILGQPISHRLSQKLRRWGKKGKEVRLRRLMALETDSAELMAELRRQRRVRKHLGDVIGPNRSEVNPDALEPLIQYLQTMGWYVNSPSEKKTGGQIQQEEHNEKSAISLSQAEAGFLLAAARIFQALGDHVALPSALPDGLMLRLQAAISADQDAAASFLADATMRRLEMLLQGYDGLPPWYAAQQEMDPLPVLHEALKHQKRVQISYWLPACGQALERTVQPYFLEKRGNYFYLTGYCFLREDERVFRVDRILKANLAPVKEDNPKRKY